VQYIGTYKALRKNNLHTKIKSVIGSSAGGIFGLAITCSLDPEEI
jgi:predicted acylesterase/phospholipase RssA